MKKIFNLTPILYIAVLVLIFSLVWGFFADSSDTITYSQVIEQFEEKNVRSFVVEDHTITLVLYNAVGGEKQLKAHLDDPAAFRAEMAETLKTQREEDILEDYDFIPEEKTSFFFSPASIAKRKMPSYIPIAARGIKRFAACVIRSDTPYCSVDSMLV